MSLWACGKCGALHAFTPSMRCSQCEGTLQFATVDPRPKGSSMSPTPDAPTLPTKRDYDEASPKAKGWMSYTFAKWPNSKIPEACPFRMGTDEADQFSEGVMAAILAAQDVDE